MDLEELQQHWNQFGEDDPLWAVLTSPDKKHGRWDQQEFFQTGVTEIASILELVDQAAAKEGTPLVRGRSLDFGCGVGRLTQALGESFARCDGVDIAPSMLKAAEEWNRHGDRCRYHLNTRDDLVIFEDESFDFVYTAHVLQHMEPQYSRRYIEEFLRVLKPGGYLLFELVTERVSGASEPLPDDGFAAKITLPAAAPQVSAGRPFMVPVRVENASRQTWPATGADGWYLVTVGNHWCHASGQPFVVDDGRALLPRDLAPGETVTVELEATAPSEPGTYCLEVDVVQEGVAWFADRGSAKARLDVVVPPPTGPGQTLLGRVASKARRALARNPSSGPTQPIMEMHGISEGAVKQLVESRHGRLIKTVDWDDFSQVVSTDWIRRGFLVIKES